MFAEHMALKTLPISKHSCADIAWIWPLTRVSTHVTLKAPGLEPQVTHITPVGPFCRVCILMLLQRAAVGKSSATRLAGVRLLTGMSAQVHNHCGSQPKTLPAHLALVRLFARVQQHMSCKPTWASGDE